MPDFGEWLEGLGLGRYAEAFAGSDIDFDVLPDLTEADLAGLGLSLGDRKRLLRAIAALRAPAAAPGETAAPEPPAAATACAPVRAAAP